MLTDKPQRDLLPGERTDKCRRMRYECGDGRCFEKEKRCQLGRLDHLFPGDNGLTDIDGTCFIDGTTLFLEWKEGGGLSRKQEQWLLNRPQDDIVIVAWGDPATMLPNEFWYREQRDWVKVVDGNVAARFDEYIRRCWKHAEAA